jgi:hypothetical protein
MRKAWNANRKCISDTADKEEEGDKEEEKKTPFW